MVCGVVALGAGHALSYHVTMPVQTLSQNQPVDVTPVFKGLKCNTYSTSQKKRTVERNYCSSDLHLLQTVVTAYLHL